MVGELAFFDENGRLATGWQKITSKMDAYSDIDIAEALYNPQVNAYTQVDANHEYDYHDFVWCYFDESGVAKENEWFKDTTDLWYYFDGNVMVKGVYDYIVNPDNYDAADYDTERRYGFDSNGAMLVGWNYKEVPTTWNDPTADDKGRIWYYYNTNGQMQGRGWKRIGSDWYLFANLNADQATGSGVGSGKWHIGGFPLIVNSYVKSYPSNTADPEYFYVDGSGKLVSGVKTIKNVYKVEFYQNSKDVSVAYEVYKTEKDKSITINFSDKGYAAKEGIEGNQYFMLKDGGEKNDIIKAPIKKINNNLYDGTDYFIRPQMGSSVLTGAVNLPYTAINSNYWLFSDRGLGDNDQNDDDEYVGETVEYTYAVTGGKVVLIKNVESTAAIAKANTAKNTYNNAWDNYLNAEYAFRKAMTQADGSIISTTVAVSGYENTDWTTTAWSVISDTSLRGRAVGNNDILKAEEDAWDAYEVAKETYENDMTAANRTALAVALENANASTLIRKAVEEKLFGTDGIAEDQKNLYTEYVSSVNRLDTAKKALTDAEAVVTNLSERHDDIWDTGDFVVRGELVKSALIGRKDDLYYADGDGNFVTNKAVLIDTNANLTLQGTTYENAYIVFGSNGKAAKGYEGTERTIVVGGVSYWSTSKTVEVGNVKATVFVSNRTVDGRR